MCGVVVTVVLVCGGWERLVYSSIMVHVLWCRYTFLVVSVHVCCHLVKFYTEFE